MLRAHVAALAARAAALTKEIGGQGFTAARYRDATGIGRNQVIRILEFFDGIGVTRRDGDCGKVMPDYRLIVGTAAPYPPPAGQARSIHCTIDPEEKHPRRGARTSNPVEGAMHLR